MTIRLYDAHAHLGSMEEQEVRKQYNIYTLMNASSIEECQKIQELAKQNSWIVPTVGVHPWKADKITVEELLPFLKSSPIIGEIGMDSTWCEVPLDVQEQVFRKQLMLAQELKKPVILHTKGQEARIREVIKPYTIPIIIHWYSEERYLRDYIAKDCYFTLGPEFKTSQAVQQVAKEVPLNRLLIETDGLEAMEWALNRKVLVNEIPDLLIEAMRYLAEIKQITLEQVAQQIEENWNHLMKNKYIL